MQEKDMSEAGRILGSKGGPAKLEKYGVEEYKRMSAKGHAARWGKAKKKGTLQKGKRQA